MGDDAKVRISGDASGATRASDQTVKGVKAVGTATEQAGKQATTAAEKATQAELKYEAQVQKAVQRLKSKEEQAKATAEAMKRLGQVDGGGAGRGVIPGGAPTVGGVAPGGVAQGLAKIGGQGGAALGALGSSLGAATPALAGLGIAAVGLKLGLDALTAASEKAAKAAAETVRLEQQRNEAVEAATKQLGQTGLNAAAEAGPALREFVAKGGSISQAQDIAARTGLSTRDASQVGAQVAGLDEGSKKVIMQAVADAVRLGVDPVKTAEALRATKGGLDGMDRESALRNAGNLFDGLSGQQIQQGLHGSNGDLNRLQTLSEFSTRDSRAAFGTLTSDTMMTAADGSTAESARRTADPITAAISDLGKTLKKEIEVLEAMGRAEHPLIRSLNDLTASMRGGAGSYTSQAREKRATIGAAGY